MKYIVYFRAYPGQDIQHEHETGNGIETLREWYVRNGYEVVDIVPEPERLFSDLTDRLRTIADGLTEADAADNDCAVQHAWFARSGVVGSVEGPWKAVVGSR